MHAAGVIGPEQIETCLAHYAAKRGNAHGYRTGPLPNFRANWQKRNATSMKSESRFQQQTEELAS